MSVRIPILDATELAKSVLVRLGHDQEDAAVAADHLIDAELRGLGYAGFGRLVSIAEQIRNAAIRNGRSAFCKRARCQRALMGEIISD